ncbi:MAG: LysR family transcriptional regulator [Hyphomicrobiaceae bacterium]|nr:MAG: LysR family transcriptional regulator [Hyphomicrobiaceae bacterium]
MEPRFTLRQIRYFLAAARAGSVTQAAYDVHISAPSISAAISQLENEFSIQLFVRHHSEGLLLTEQGRALFAAAKGFYDHAEQLENTGRGLGKSVSGVIYAGCFVTLAPLIVPRISKAFSRAFPEARMSFTEGHQASLFAALRDGLVQVAFGYDMGIGGDLVFEAFGEVEPYCILPAGHRLAGSRELSLKALQSEPMIVLDLPKSREYFLSLYERAGAVPNIAHRTTSLEVVRAMVAHGLGYSLLSLPNLHTVCPDGSEIAVVRLSDTLPKLSIGMLASADTTATHIYEAVRSVAEEVITGLLAQPVRPELPVS